MPKVKFKATISTSKVVSETEEIVVRKVCEPVLYICDQEAEVSKADLENIKADFGDGVYEIIEDDVEEKPFKSKKQKE